MVFVRSLSRKTIDSSSEHYKSAYRKIKLQHTDCPVNPKRQYEWLKALEELSAKIGQNPRLSLERYVWKDLFVECYERQNIALSRIAEALGVHVNRVHRLKKKYGIPTNSEASYQERLKHYGGSYKGLFDIAGILHTGNTHFRQNAQLRFRNLIGFPEAELHGIVAVGACL